jgi:hypothetical protein
MSPISIYGPFPIPKSARDIALLVVPRFRGNAPVILKAVILTAVQKSCASRFAGQQKDRRGPECAVHFVGGHAPAFLSE